MDFLINIFYLRFGNILSVLYQRTDWGPYIAYLKYTLWYFENGYHEKLQ